jgi:hypothetical protein
MNTSRMILLLAAFLGLTGCTSSGRVHEVNPGIYSSSATGDGYVSAPRLRKRSLDRAEEFCAHQGKRMTLAREDIAETHTGSDTTISVTFSCVEG